MKDEAFVVLGGFHKRIERFFHSIDSDPSRKLVYERRKRQYADTTYTAKNIVTLTFLTNSFVSCCLESPVDANDYYGVLLRKHKLNMYVQGHSMWPYLVSATILKEIEKKCVGRAKPVLWKFRFIIALLIRRGIGKLPSLRNDKLQKKYAEHALSICEDENEFQSRILIAEQCLADAVDQQGSAFDVRNAHQDRRFVASLLESNPAS